MNNQDYNKWFLELANQEYNGNLKALKFECDLIGGC